MKEKARETRLFRLLLWMVTAALLLTASGCIYTIRWMRKNIKNSLEESWMEKEAAVRQTA